MLKPETHAWPYQGFRLWFFFEKIVDPLASTKRS